MDLREATLRCAVEPPVRTLLVIPDGVASVANRPRRPTELGRPSTRAERVEPMGVEPTASRVRF